MPTIEVTPAQKAAYDKGKPITLTPPATVAYAASMIGSGNARQTFHAVVNHNVDDAKGAVIKWLTEPSLGLRLLRAEFRDRPVIVTACPTSANGKDSRGCPLDAHGLGGYSQITAGVKFFTVRTGSDGEPIVTLGVHIVT